MATNLRPATRAELLTQSSGRQVPGSQATTIEQSRAVAQVQGALIVAQQRPRDTLAAAERMREACGNLRMADRAFFSYSRGGSTVTGGSIHLAREIARCWGNVDYGVVELSRDDLKGESEMQAYAWDLETNARITNSFIVPHRRDSSGGAKKLTDQRDIYENNTNNAARRLRECIFGILPRSFRDEAEDLCRETLEKGTGEPIEQRRRKLVEAFAAIGVTQARIAKRAGTAADRLTAFQVGQLGIDYRSIKNGEATAEDLFPSDVGETAAEELRGRGKTPAPETQPPKEAPMKEMVKIVDAEGAVVATTSIGQEAWAAYEKAKQHDPREVAIRNVEALRTMLTYAKGGIRTKIEREIAAAEVAAESPRDDEADLLGQPQDDAA
jgi:hypothetical protein